MENKNTEKMPKRYVFTFILMWFVSIFVFYLEFHPSLINHYILFFQCASGILLSVVVYFFYCIYAIEAWNQIMIWQDRNSNGKVDSGELLTLESAGIAGIDLDYTHQEVVDANGNAHKQSGTVIKSDGTTGSIADVWFDTNPEATIDDLQTEIPEAVLALPNISGSGNVHNLHTAMALV